MMISAAVLFIVIAVVLNGQLISGYVIKRSNCRGKCSRPFFTKLSLADTDILDDSSSSLFSDSGPGHIKSAPLSTAERSRLDLAKIVVSVAITALTLKMKTDSFAQKFAQLLGSDEESSGIVEFPCGIKYQDVKEGAAGIPSAGSLTEMELKIFYNGMEIENFNAENWNESGQQLVGKQGHRVAFRYGQYNKIFDQLGLSGLNYAVNDVDTVLTSNRFARGGTRSITLPAQHAFGDRGLYPYIPAGATVRLEVQLLP